MRSQFLEYLGVIVLNVLTFLRSNLHYDNVSSRPVFAILNRVESLGGAEHDVWNIEPAVIRKQ